MAEKHIIISQKEPKLLTVYDSLSKKYGVNFTFKPFYHIEPLSSLEYRAQKLNILDHTAVVFSSRSAIDAFFKISEEHRIKIPEDMKYFCSTEIVANYLQKHIVYRKRKIFCGNGTAESIITAIGTKHVGEHFLIVACDSNKNELTDLMDKKGLKYTCALFIKSVLEDLSGVDFSKYDAAVLYNPSDVHSILKTYPEFKQGNLKIISYGKSVVKALEEAHLNIAVAAPTPDIPSAAKAIEVLLSE